MKINFLILFILIQITNLKAQYSKIEWVATSEKSAWVTHKVDITKKSSEKPMLELLIDKSLQTIDGFGACFNELGWTSLNQISEKDRKSILKELFAPNFGANFTICRMPVGANDFSLDWFSYNETEGDFDMKNFSIIKDQKTLVPFIKNAMSFNPKLALWASPWSPPSWMKWNKHYACQISSSKLDPKYRNDLDSLKQGKEGTNMFIQKAEYFKAYSLYFSKFIKEYRKQGIKISMVMPQNEFNSCQIFPSCTWTASGLAKFIGEYLGPEMKKQNVEIMFGTMERPNKALVDTILQDEKAKNFIKGVGFQWAGKKAISDVHKAYSTLKLYQTEQECGNGKNDWKYCCYAWDLMKHYFSNGASAYMYWNISLEKGGFSRWGWQQNSLITVDASSKSYQFNHEYYLMKHFSHYIMPGAKMIQSAGEFKNLLAFINPDKSIVLVAQNETAKPLELSVKLGNNTFTSTLEPMSFNTFCVK